MSIVIMVVVFIVKELNDKYKAKLPVPIPIEVIMVSQGVPLGGGGGSHVLSNITNAIHGILHVTKLHKPFCNLIFESELTRWMMVCVQLCFAMQKISLSPLHTAVWNLIFGFLSGHRLL